MGSTSLLGVKMALSPLKVKKIVRIITFIVFTVSTSKNPFLIYAPSPEILVKMRQILLVWFGRSIFDTFFITWDSLHIFGNRLLR